MTIESELLEEIRNLKSHMDSRFDLLATKIGTNTQKINQLTTLLRTTKKETR